MTLPVKGKIHLLGALALSLALPPASALLNIDGSRNQVFVFGSVAVGYNSNVFSDSTERGDYTVTADAGAELKRRAGIIAVNATARLAYVSYGKYSEESTLNPNFLIEFSKATGRTTGSITVNAYRESRSDSAVNLRTSSWNFPLGLNLRYPINEKFYVTSTTSYLRRRYTDTTVLANYTDYVEGLDLYYVYTSKLDLIGGYRIRISRTSLGNDSTDHWFNLGASGRLLAKLNGSIRLGYQIRQEDGSAHESFSHYNASGSLSWPVTRKLGLSGTLNRDFNTIATGSSVDSSSLGLQATYSFTRKLEFGAGAAFGRNEFLGSTQPTPRTDSFFSFDLSAHYKMNEHLTLGAGYNYFRNQSSLSFSEFDRQGFTFDIASRY